MRGKEETNSMSGKEETNSMSGKEDTNHIEIKPVEIKFKKRHEMYKGHGVMRKIKS